MDPWLRFQRAKKEAEYALVVKMKTPMLGSQQKMQRAWTNKETPPILTNESRCMEAKQGEMTQTNALLFAKYL